MTRFNQGFFSNGRTDNSSSGKEMLYLTNSQIDFDYQGKQKLSLVFKMNNNPICVLYGNEQNDN